MCSSRQISLDEHGHVNSSSVSVRRDVYAVQLLLKGKLGGRPVWEHIKFIEYWKEKAERHTWFLKGVKLFRAKAYGKI